MSKAIWGVLTLALLVRLWGVTHSLPDVYYPDEQHFVNRALAFGSGDLNPHWFHKPAFYMYILFFEYGCYYVVGRALGWFASIDEFAKHYFTDASTFFIIGRTTTALLGVATVYLTYLIGRRSGKEWLGVIAALFLAVTFGHVESSHFALTDVPTTFFTLLAFLFIVQVAETGRTRDYMLAGFFAGLGTATKYYSVILLPSLYLAHVLFHHSHGKFWRKGSLDGNIVGGVASWLGGFFLGSPYNFIDPHFRTGFVPVFTGGGVDTKGIPDRTLNEVLLAIFDAGKVIVSPTAMGWVLGSLALIGVAYLVYRHSRKDVLIVTSLLSFFLLAALLVPFHAEARHLNPIYPLLCLSAAAIIDELLGIKWLKERGWLASWVCIVAIIPSVYGVVQYDYLVSQKETRTLAKEWIEANIPAGAKILLDSSGPSLRWSRQSLADLYERAKQFTTPGPFTTHLEPYLRYRMEAASGVTYDITQIERAWWREEETPVGSVAMTAHDVDSGNPMWERGVKPLNYYKDNGYQYAITTSDDYRSSLEGPNKARFPQTSAFYRDLFEHGILVKEFNPEPWRRSGPVVRIFILDGQRAAH